MWSILFYISQSAIQHVPPVSVRLSRRYSNSLHTCCSISTITVCTASIIYQSAKYNEILNRGLVDIVLDVSPKEKIQGVMSGERGGQGIGPSHPSHLAGKWLTKIFRT